MLQIRKQFGTKHRVEAFWRGPAEVRRNRKPKLLPPGQAAVQDTDLIVPEHSKHPPGPGGRKKMIVVVNDHPRIIADSQLPRLFGKLNGIGQRMGQGTGRIGDVIDVEKLRAWDMRCIEFLWGITLLTGQKVGGIQDDSIGNIRILL